MNEINWNMVRAQEQRLGEEVVLPYVKKRKFSMEHFAMELKKTKEWYNEMDSYQNNRRKRNPQKTAADEISGG